MGRGVVGPALQHRPRSVTAGNHYGGNYMQIGIKARLAAFVAGMATAAAFIGLDMLAAIICGA